MSRNRAPSDPFFTGGALSPDSLSYVERPADDDLFDSVLAGKFCCVFAPHHMGKSSLMLRTARRLEQRGVKTITADLARFSADSSIARSLQYLAKRVKYQLKLSVDPVTWWWVEQAHADPTQRLVDFLRDEVLGKVEGPVAIFLDGIDTTLDPDILDSFLTAIRFIYQARETNPVWRRLTFVLLGSISPYDLIGNHGHFPFGDCHHIDLREFSPEEAQVLQQGLQATRSDDDGTVFSRIFDWTNGHPYLTQKLCLAVANAQDGDCTGEWVDGLVNRMFLSPEAGKEPNLQLAKDSIKTSRGRRQLLSCYRRVYKGKKVEEDKGSTVQSRLKLIGLVRGDSGSLKVRNEVYRRVFDSAWISANMPVNWTLRFAAVGVLLVLLLVGFVNLPFSQQQEQQTEPQVYIDRFRNSSDPDEQLISLVGLFKLGGHDDEARRLFYEELSPADQLALFEMADPQAMGEELITLVKGVYTDPRLRNSEQSNAVLGAMAQPLTQLVDSGLPGAIELDLEIRQWLKGREYYNGEGQYRQAIHEYDTAIKLNNHNPGIYFDRAEAYVARGETIQAFADFEEAISLDQRWQEPVQEALTSDAQLHTALWLVPGEYEGLIALVPTLTSAPASVSSPSPTSLPPTSTPSATSVPSTSTPTLTLTSTPTSVPTNTPKATPTASRTATSTATSTATRITTRTATPTNPPTTAATSTPTRRLTPTSPTPTPVPTSDAQLTPTAPSGAFTLLEPLSLENPTYGPTNFVWEWTGSVPPGIGFEVRVWREGEPQVGAHNALFDNQNGNIQNIDGEKYRLNTNIENAAGVRERNGTYFWTVALVQVSPSYKDLARQAEPAQLRVELGSTSDDGGDAGGSVGIE